MSRLIRSFNIDFSQIVKIRSNSPALINGKSEEENFISYKEFSNLINRTISLFQKKGIYPGDTVLSLMPNSIETLILFFASMKGGYKFAPLECTATKKDLEKWIKITDPKICFTTDLVDNFDEKIFSSKKIPIIKIKIDAKFNWLPLEIKFQENNSCQSFIYLFTSGTTGNPKAIMIKSDILWSSGYAFAKHHSIIGSNLRFWNYLPMSYLGGLFNLAIIPICVGGSIVVDEPFSGKTFLEYWPYIERFNINALWLVPSIIKGLITLDSRNKSEKIYEYKSKIKKCFLGTAPIEAITKKKFYDLYGIYPLENYALSETTFITSEHIEHININDIGKKNGIGKILPYVDIKLLSKFDDENKSHDEIFVKSPFLFEGYLKEGGKIQKVLDPAGYLATGDLGKLSKNNELFLTGRSKDIIKKGGYFIALREIEKISEQNENILEAVAVKKSHEFYGESYVLFVTLNGKHEKSKIDNFNIWLHENLTKFKWPEKIIITDKFPRTGSGKVIKHKLLKINSK
jgi:acyl-coenzyme A synthetase/AMP-(fatty) acid ligase